MSAWVDEPSPPAAEVIAVESIKPGAFLGVPTLQAGWNTVPAGGAERDWLALLAESVEAADRRGLQFGINAGGPCKLITGVLRLGGFGLGAGRLVKVNPSVNRVRVTATLIDYTFTCFTGDCTVKVYDGPARTLLASQGPVDHPGHDFIFSLPIAYSSMLDKTGSQLEVEITANTSQDFTGPTFLLVDAVEWQVQTHRKRWRDE